MKNALNGLKCPLCGGRIVENSRAYGCSNWKENGCEFTIWKEMSGTRIPEEQVAKLIKDGISDELQFVSRKGKKFKSRLVLKDGKIFFEFALQK